MLFKGVCTALATPFDGKGINYKKLEDYIDFQIEQGVDGFVLAGTTGEAPTISDEEKKELFRRGVKIVAGRVPVFAGTGSNNTAHTVELSKYALDAGADGLLINNPYYNKSSDEGICAHFEAVSDAVDLPIIVYNVPSRTARNISVKLALELCKIKNIKAFKEASGDISQIAELCAKKPEDIAVYSGNDEQTLPVMAVGGMGVICTCSNIAPKLCCSITDAFFAGNLEDARKKQFELLDLHKAIFMDANPIPLKTAMNIIGMEAGPLRLPLVELAGEKRQRLAAVLKQYGFKTVKE